MSFRLNMLCKISSVATKIPQICIVGAGPAGFYAAMHLTKNLMNVNVDILDKLPVPFGLIRYGVAPDHPEVKNVINQFSKVAQQENVNFYGNINLGEDIDLHQLRRHYDAVLLTLGAEEDKTLGIENEDCPDVIAARNFVGWYNGHPNHKDLEIDLSGPTAAIFGQGNVALDVARILLSSVDELKKTDITDYAISALAESKIKELYLVGRRGPLQVAFTIKELRELLKLKTCRTIWRESDFIGVSELVNDLPRPRKRLTELMLKSLNEIDTLNKESGQKLFKSIFFRSPNKFLVDEEARLTGIELSCNMLVGEKLEEQKFVRTEETEILNCNLAFRSIGYKSVSVDKDLALNSDNIVPNNRGRVIEDKTDNLAKLYVAGWLGTGPVGVILHTMGNAFQVGKTICEDLKNCDTQNKAGFNEVKKLLDANKVVDWNGWQKIDRYEIDMGKKSGKPREKISTVEKMVAVAKM